MEVNNTEFSFLDDGHKYTLKVEQANCLDEIEVSKIPLELKGFVDIINKDDSDGGERIIAGWANLAVVDSDNQFIPVEVLKNGLETLINDPAYANLMLVHKNIQIGKILEEWGDYKTHVDERGLFVIAEIRSDIKTANEVWELILNKEINGFSIGCEVLASHDKCNSEGCMTVLDEINIFEISIANNPINEDSGFIVISKSKFNELNVCNECNSISDTMTKKNVKVDEKESSSAEVKTEIKSEEPKEIVEEKTEEPKEEEKGETEEISDLEERLAKAEREIAALEGIIEEANKQEEDEEEEEEEEEEKKSVEEPPEQAKAEEPKEVKSEEPIEEKTEELVDYTAQFDSLKEGIDNLVKSIGEVKDILSKATTEKKEKGDIEELKMALKARDDLIEALKKKVEIITKSSEDKEQPKTVQEESKESELPELEEEKWYTKKGHEYQLQF